MNRNVNLETFRAKQRKANFLVLAALAGGLCLIVSPALYPTRLWVCQNGTCNKAESFPGTPKAVAVKDDGTFWASHDSGLSRYQSGSWKHYSPPEFLRYRENTGIRGLSLMTVSEEHLWAAEFNNNSVIHFDGNHWELHEQNLPDRIQSITAEGSQAWAGGTDEASDSYIIAHFDGQSWQQRSFPELSDDFHSRSIGATQGGTLWVYQCHRNFSRSELYKLNGKKLELVSRHGASPIQNCGYIVGTFKEQIVFADQYALTLYDCAKHSWSTIPLAPELRGQPVDRLIRYSRGKIVGSRHRTHFVLDLLSDKWEPLTGPPVNYNLFDWAYHDSACLIIGKQSPSDSRRYPGIFFVALLAAMIAAALIYDRKKPKTSKIQFEHTRVSPIVHFIAVNGAIIFVGSVVFIVFAFYQGSFQETAAYRCEAGSPCRKTAVEVEDPRQIHIISDNNAWVVGSSSIAYATDSWSLHSTYEDLGLSHSVSSASSIIWRDDLWLQGSSTTMVKFGINNAKTHITAQIYPNIGDTGSILQATDNPSRLLLLETSGDAWHSFDGDRWRHEAIPQAENSLLPAVLGLYGTYFDETSKTWWIAKKHNVWQRRHGAWEPLKVNGENIKGRIVVQKQGEYVWVVDHEVIHRYSTKSKRWDKLHLYATDRIPKGFFKNAYDIHDGRLFLNTTAGSFSVDDHLKIETLSQPIPNVHHLRSRAPSPNKELEWIIVATKNYSWFQLEMLLISFLSTGLMMLMYMLVLYKEARRLSKLKASRDKGYELLQQAGISLEQAKASPDKLSRKIVKFINSPEVSITLFVLSFAVTIAGIIGYYFFGFGYFWIELLCVGVFVCVLTCVETIGSGISSLLLRLKLPSTMEDLGVRLAGVFPNFSALARARSRELSGKTAEAKEILRHRIEQLGENVTIAPRLPAFYGSLELADSSYKQAALLLEAALIFGHHSQEFYLGLAESLLSSSDRNEEAYTLTLSVKKRKLEKRASVIRAWAAGRLGFHEFAASELDEVTLWFKKKLRKRKRPLTKEYKHLIYLLRKAWADSGYSGYGHRINEIESMAALDLGEK